MTDNQINKSLMYGELPDSQRTGMKCDCGFPDMQIVGFTKDGYSKYRCPNCKSKTDSDPKNARLRQKIDRRFRDITTRF